MHQFDNMCRSKHLNVYFPNVIDAKKSWKALTRKKDIIEYKQI